MSSAQLEMPPLEAPPEAMLHEGLETRPSPLRQQMAERLAAHRLRRARHPRAVADLQAQAVLDMDLPPLRNKIAATVAERYAHSPSYRAFLAQEAQRAIEEAAAAAQVAARNAEAVASAQQSLLAELELWTAPQEFTTETAVTLGPGTVPATPRQRAPRQTRADDLALTFEAASAELSTKQTPVMHISSAGLTVRLYEDLGRPALLPADLRRIGDRTAIPLPGDLDEALALDDEIAFRQTPVFENYRDPTGPMDPIAANLVEFPRQLIATKKARPRLAEGPLREEAPRSPQLRIFEVEAEQISQQPAPSSSAPEWSSIRLDAHTVTEAAALAPDEVILPSLLPPQTAPMPLRLMAVALDAILILAAFVAFATAAAYVSGHVPAGIDAVTVSAVTLAVFFLLYQALFFTLSDQTPGMRFARIGLCTMTDENPSRSAMRKRIVAILIAACPMGIGLLWVFLDDERLGWHDRISRMYQRAY